MSSIPNRLHRSTSTSFSVGPLVPDNRLRSRSISNVNAEPSAPAVHTPTNLSTFHLPLSLATVPPSPKTPSSRHHELEPFSSDESDDGPPTPSDLEPDLISSPSPPPWLKGKLRDSTPDNLISAWSTLPLPHKHHSTPPSHPYQDSVSSTSRLPSPTLGRRASAVPHHLLGRPPKPPLTALLRPIGILVLFFAFSTTGIIFLVSTVPTLSLPHSLTDVAHQAVALRDYSSSSNLAFTHVLIVLAILFCYKQAFSIPGSILLNVLFGHLYSIFPATLLTSGLTALGSILAYLLARLCEPLAKAYAPSAVEALERKIPKCSSKSGLFAPLLLLRLFPLIPYAAINVAAGVLRVPITPFFWSLVLGSMPFNAVTTQVGDILATTGPAGSSQIWSLTSALKLIGISLVAAVPVLFQSQIKKLIGDGSEGTLPTNPNLSIEPSSALSQLPPPSKIWGWKRRKASVVEGFDREDQGDYLVDEEFSAIEAGVMVPLIEVGHVW